MGLLHPATVLRGMEWNRSSRRSVWLCCICIGKPVKRGSPCLHLRIHSSIGYRGARGLPVTIPSRSALWSWLHFSWNMTAWLPLHVLKWKAAKSGRESGDVTAICCGFAGPPIAWVTMNYIHVTLIHRKIYNINISCGVGDIWLSSFFVLPWAQCIQQ